MTARLLSIACLLLLLLTRLVPTTAQATPLAASTPTRTPTPRTFAAEMAAAGLSTWRSGPNMLETRSGPALVAWKDTLFVLGGITQAGYPLDSIESAKIGSKIILSEWQSLGKMSNARSNFKAVMLGSYLYVLGGQGWVTDTAANKRVVGPLASVAVLGISFEGKILYEQYLRALPEPRWDFGAATARGYIYIAGGLTAPDDLNWKNKIAITSSVIYAPVYPDGTLGEWQQTTSLDMPMSGVELVAANGYLYAIGGESISQKYNTVRYAQILKDGSLGKWQRTSDMNEARAFAAILSDDEYLYAVGGDLPMAASGEIAPKTTSSVEYTQIRSDGTLSRWRLTKSLPGARDRVAGVAVSSSVTNISNGYMFIAGGYTNQNDEVNSAMNSTGYNFAIGRGPAINVEFAPQPTATATLPATSTSAPAPTDTLDVGLIYTQAAQTVQAVMTQTELARPTQTDTPEAANTTPDVPILSETPQPTPANTSTPTLAPSPSETRPPAPTLTPQPTAIGGEQTSKPSSAQMLQTAGSILGILAALVLIVYFILRQKYKGQRLVFNWPGSKPPNQL